jgi:hypothetical protein
VHDNHLRFTAFRMERSNRQARTDYFGIYPRARDQILQAINRRGTSKVAHPIDGRNPAESSSCKESFTRVDASQPLIFVWHFIGPAARLISPASRRVLITASSLNPERRPGPSRSFFNPMPCLAEAEGVVAPLRPISRRGHRALDIGSWRSRNRLRRGI